MIQQVVRVHTKKTEEVIKFSVAPCFRCGNEDIRLYNYEDGQGPPLRGGECPKCKVRFQETGAGDHADAAKYWNKHNDPQKMIEEQEMKIINSKKRIKELRLIIAERENKEEETTI